MTYKIEQIEGIGPDFGARLAAAGIHTTDDLLTRTLTMDARQRLSMTTGLSVLQLTTWRHQADLMRVSGIGSEDGQLLEASGIETVGQLATRKPENVVNLLDRVNAEKRLPRQVPPLKTVSKWIAKAREMVPAHANASHANASHANVSHVNVSHADASHADASNGAQTTTPSSAPFSPRFPMR